ncbi:MAG: oligosaccharide flippase family protein [Candidatus Omnitrophica bacterium]|jgi:O-antigen/teichoic acid export membrane protein|nr:oligosaccharide flippase family protein [Candidatus Omnitrophota bacterium]
MNKPSSFSTNLFVNYVSQIYIVIVGIVTVPLFFKYMGAEAYGLVGFFIMLQVWFNLFDMGLTPTMARETARFRGEALDKFGYCRLVKSLEGVFLAIALTGGGAIFLVSGYVARNWLKVTQLPITEVQKAVQLMAVIIAMRWMCGLYRGGIIGFERLVWLGWYNSFIATLRFIGVLPVLIFIGATPVIFFSYQFIITVLELAGLILYAHSLLPNINREKWLFWSWEPLKPVLKFSLAIAFASLVWVLVTQMDKLILSKLLPLVEYGYFTLAVLVASSVMIVSTPVSAAIMPRMAKLESEGNHLDLILVYRRATQLVAVVASAVSATLVFYAEPLLWVWTGDKVLAHQAAPILILYAIGNGILAVSAFPYYLQYAKGDLRIHLTGNAVFVILLIPFIIWAVSLYGGVGAGYVWLIMNLVFFIAWLPFVHRKFAPGLNIKWYTQDVLMILLVSAVAGYCLSLVLPHSNDRYLMAASIVRFGFLVMLVAISASSVARSKVKMFFGRLQKKPE